MMGKEDFTAARFGILQTFEHGLACGLAQSVTDPRVVLTLRAASRYGDWGLSATVGILLLIDRSYATAGAWAIATITALIIQDRMKKGWARHRPCARPDGPPQRAPIPDPGSFPSGHTLHAALGAVVLTWSVPGLGQVFVLVAVLVGVSRVVLGVHYPSDVLAGASIGIALGSTVNLIIPG
jgi:undecaprenyl-diphosphatase